MVSNAREDLPEPDRPVITTSLSRGMSTSIFLRLWTRAPRTAIQSCAIRVLPGFLESVETTIVPWSPQRLALVCRACEASCARGRAAVRPHKEARNVLHRNRALDATDFAAA